MCTLKAAFKKIKSIEFLSFPCLVKTWTKKSLLIRAYFYTMKLYKTEKYA